MLHLSHMEHLMYRHNCNVDHKAAKDLVRARLAGKESKPKDSKPKEKKHELVIELTDSNFDELVMNSEDVWMLKFFAP